MKETDFLIRLQGEVGKKRECLAREYEENTEVSLFLPWHNVNIDKSSYRQSENVAFIIEILSVSDKRKGGKVSIFRMPALLCLTKWVWRRSVT